LNLAGKNESSVRAAAIMTHFWPHAVGEVLSKINFTKQMYFIFKSNIIYM